MYVHFARARLRGEGLSGRELLTQVNRIATIAITGANVIGAVITFIYLTLLLKVRHPPPVDKVLLWNWPAGAVYLVVASIVAPRWGRSIAQSRHRWLVEERPPTREEQRRTLRTPLVQIKVSATMWAVAAVVFTVVALVVSQSLFLLLPVVLAGWYVWYMPLWRAKVRRRARSLPTWNLTPE